MRYLKCNLLPERHEEILRKFWDYPTQEEEDAVHDLFTPHVFFETYGKRREVWATCCRQHGIIGKHGPKHGSEGSCPFCGQTAVWSAIGKYSERMTSLREETHVAFLRRDGDALLIEAMQIEISYTKDLIYEGIYYDMNCWGQKAYYFAPGTVQMWVRTREWRCGEWTLPYWKAKATVSEPFQPNMMGWACYQGDYTVIGADALSETKAWRYCQIEDWMHYELAERWEDEPVKWAVTYLAAYAMWPQIEMAVKIGLGSAVTQLVVHSLKNWRTLDWDATNPADFMRMSKQEARAWLQSGGDFETLKSWRETAPELTPDVYIHLCRQLGGGRMVEACKECAEMAGVKLEKAARYAENKTRVELWVDYLRMARELGYDLAEATVAMPKDLRERHDAADELLGMRRDQAVSAAYAKRYKKLCRKYEFAMSGLRIVVPKGGSEIIREGKTLHHCVGGYAARHIEGKTTILFLRHEKRPERPWMTIELTGSDTIRQIHGYRNEGYNHAQDPGERYGWFLDAWLAWVHNGSRRDKKGRPVIAEAKEKTA